MDSIKHGLHTVCKQASGATCRVDAWHFDNIITHMLGAEASVSGFVGWDGGDGLRYSCSQDT